MRFKLLLGSLVLSLMTTAQAENFTLTSPDITNDKPLTKQQEFQGFGCTGENRSPALQWSNPPAGTKSFALTVYDPDAPTGSGWWHWVVFNLPATTTSLPANIDNKGTGLPQNAIQSRTDFGQVGFGGACPPQGDKPHHYHFTVHALKTEKLDLDKDAMPAMVGYMLHANTLGTASLTATYQR